MYCKFISCFIYREEVEKFFLEMDRDFDGKLSFEEFMGEETSLERLFKSMDKNGDGSVTKEVKFFLFMILSGMKNEAIFFCPIFF